MKKRLLIADDDHSLRMVLKEALSNCGYDVEVAKDGKAALDLLDSKFFDLIIADLRMPDMDGIQLLAVVGQKHPNIGFLMITAYGTIEIAVDAMHKGAFDFITKPFSISQVESRIRRYFEFDSLKRENKDLRRRLSNAEGFKKLVGRSEAMQDIFHLIEVVADSDASVFIQGESGTGKELIAQSIHDHSGRAGQPFLKINCSAIPESLFESTLFGHEKGSFTNAYKTHQGIFEAAHGGTLLLDEISEIPLPMQAKLLRVLQEGAVTRVGGTAEIPVDVRIVSTSNRVIARMIEEERFRSDLFFRLNVFPIRVPPLRARPEDIPVLTDHFLSQLRSKYGYERKTLSKSTLNELVQYSWPGNVRELENLMERAVLFSGDDDVLTPQHFMLELDQFQLNRETEFDGPLCTIAELEKKLIYATLRKTGNNRTQAAKILDISVRTLRNKLHQYEVETKSSELLL